MTPENVKSKSLRVALIVSENMVSEHSIFLEHIMVGLADASIPVALVCPPDCDFSSVFTGAAEVIDYPVFNLPFMEHLNIRLLVERLRRFEPTVLHCLCENKTSLAQRLSRQLNLPYVLTVHSLHKRWSKLIVSLGRCTKIIVPAKTIADNVAKVYRRCAERIEQINIGTFVTENSRCFTEPSRVATIVVAHPSDKADDFEKLFNAFRHLMIDRYEFMAVVTSSGRADRQLWKLLSALGLLQTVTIVPRMKPWRSALLAGDIFIQPKPTSAFNPLLLEAMSIGLAIAGCKGGVDDMIIENQTAVVFDPNDELSIMGTLQQLLSKKEFARKVAQTAQQYVRENHTVSKMISATLQVYQEVQE